MKKTRLFLLLAIINIVSFDFAYSTKQDFFDKQEILNQNLRMAVFNQMPRYLYSQADSKDSVDDLLKKGAQPGVTSSESTSKLLLLSALELRQDGYAISLITYGANINAIDPNNSKTALHIAVENNMQNVVNVLLRKKAPKVDIYLKDNYGHTAFFYALTKDKNLVELFLKYISKSSLPKLNNMENYVVIRDLLDQKKYKLLEFLVSKNIVDLNQHYSGQPVIYDSIYNKNIDNAQRLIDLGADVDDSALDYARNLGNSDASDIISQTINKNISNKLYALKVNRLIKVLSGSCLSGLILYIGYKYLNINKTNKTNKINAN